MKVVPKKASSKNPSGPSATYHMFISAVCSGYVSQVEVLLVVVPGASGGPGQHSFRGFEELGSNDRMALGKYSSLLILGASSRDDVDHRERTKRGGRLGTMVPAPMMLEPVWALRHRIENTQLAWLYNRYGSSKLQTVDSTNLNWPWRSLEKG